MSLLRREFTRIIVKPESTFDWDDWERSIFLPDGFTKEFERLEPMCRNAALSIALPMGEWIAACLRHSKRAFELDDYLDAAWLAVLDDRMPVGVDFIKSDWLGPENAPLQLAAVFVNELFYHAAEDGKFWLRAAWAAMLARYVCPKYAKDALENILKSGLQAVRERYSDVAKFPYDDIFDSQFANGPVPNPKGFLPAYLDAPADFCSRFQVDLITSREEDAYFEIL